MKLGSKVELKKQFGKLAEHFASWGIKREDAATQWAQTQAGITPEAVLAAGGTSVLWPNSHRYGQPCLAFPAYRSRTEPAAAVVYRADGSNFPAHGNLAERKVHTIRGSKPAWHHFDSIDRTKSAEVVWWSEGLKDAMAVSPHIPDNHGIISPSHGCHWPSNKKKQPPIGFLRDKPLNVVGDADTGGQEGAQDFARAAAAVAKEVRLVKLPYPIEDSGGKDLRDYLNEGHSFDDLLQLAEDAATVKPSTIATRKKSNATAQTHSTGTANGGGFVLPPGWIELTHDEKVVNDQVITQLAERGIIFEYCGTLAQVEGGKILKLTASTLREQIADTVSFAQEITDKMLKALDAGKLSLEEIRARPPAWSFKAVFERGSWLELRTLTGVVDSPVLRPGGSVLQTSGYDPESGLYAAFDMAFPPLPENPTSDEISVAVELLRDVVSDFPFESPLHEAAWFAALLTPLARPAYHGATGPLFLIDANVRGSGKSLLADLIAIIVTGREAVRFTAPNNDEEARKRITALVESGDRLVLIDNIAGKLGSASLDAALTGTIWKDRRLGHTAMVEAPLTMTWIATGNNVLLAADTARRTCHIRLRSAMENPEDRDSFRHTDVRRYVRENRPELLKAALTILRGYVAAGRTDQKLKPWGSFEEWSDLVRSSIVHAGLPDPGETRDELRNVADSTAAALQQLIEILARIDPEGHGLSSAEMLTIATGNGDVYALDERDQLSEVITLICDGRADKASSQKLGNALGHFRQRVVGGRSLERRTVSGRNLWFVEFVVGGPSGPGGPLSSDLSAKDRSAKNTEAGTVPTAPSAEVTQNRPTSSTRSTMESDYDAIDLADL